MLRFPLTTPPIVAAADDISNLLRLAGQCRRHDSAVVWIIARIGSN